MSLEALLSKAWQVRCEHWPPVLDACYPVGTLPISVTGEACALNCAHCGGRYLRGMRPLDGVFQVRQPSVLISGGCDARGRVPVWLYRERLAELVRGKRSNWHLGLVSEAELAAVGDLLDVVSLDFVGDDQTIREVYGLAATVADYEEAYRACSRWAMVVPHITIGLRGGRLGHERAALERLRGLGPRRLVFLVFIPTAGTRFGHLAPPRVEEVAELLAEARLLFPEAFLQLGCMRPQGEYRLRLDRLAVEAGVNSVVNPAAELKEHCAALGLRWRESFECCVFSPQEG